MSGEPKSARLLTASDVARYCQVDLKTVHNWVVRDRLRHFRTPGRHLRFRPSDVLDFLREYGYPIPEELAGQRPPVIVATADAARLTAMKRSLSRRYEVIAVSHRFDALVAVGRHHAGALVADAELLEPDLAAVLERLAACDASSRPHVVVVDEREVVRQRALDAGADAAISPEPSEIRDALDRLRGE